jgi:hypothetical protein
MEKESTTISIRIPRSLNDSLTQVSDELNLKKIDFIRFLLVAGVKLDKKKLKTHLQKVYEKELENGISAVIENCI